MQSATQLSPIAGVTRTLVTSTQSLASVRAHLSAVAVEDLESLEETLAILADEDTMRQLREAERKVAAGDTVDATQLRTLMDRRAQSE